MTGPTLFRSRDLDFDALRLLQVAQFVNHFAHTRESVRYLTYFLDELLSFEFVLETKLFAFEETLL